MNPYDAFIVQWRTASAHAHAAMMEEAEQIIASSRKSIQPRLREVLDECQADRDDEYGHGWWHEKEFGGGEE